MRVELLDKDQKHTENAGLHPWSLENGSESTLLLFNHYPTAEQFDVSIAAGHVAWQKSYTLRAFETLALSLRQLQLEQTKSDNGKVLPRTAESGQISWFNTKGPQGTGRILISNRDIQMARSFSCGSYFELCGTSISPGSPAPIAVGGSISFTANDSFCW